MHLACKYLETLFQRPKTHYKFQIRKVSISHIPVFHACVPTHLEPTSQDTIQISIRKFSSHTSQFWTLPEQIRPRMCANPEPMLQRYTTKPQTPKFSSHTSLLWTLPGQLSILYHAQVPTHPEPTSQDTLQISDPKIFISHIPVLNFAGTTRNRWHHACVPTLNQRYKDTPQKLRPQDFHLTHPSFELCRSSSPYYTTHVCQPIRNQRPKTHYKFQSENVHLTHPCFELCRNNPEQTTPRMCANPSCRHTTRSKTPRFSSHTSLFWTLPEQLSILHHACVPTLNQHSEDTTRNFRP